MTYSHGDKNHIASSLRGQINREQNMFGDVWKWGQKAGWSGKSNRKDYMMMKPGYKAM